jgi:hypothetical protein
LAFSVPFRFLAISDLVVLVRVDATGADTTKTLDTHYSVSGEGAATGGTVTFLIEDGEPQTGETLIIYGNPAMTQLVDYIAGGTFPAESHEEALDRLTLQSTRTREIAERAMFLTDSSTDGSGEYDANNNDIDSVGVLTATKVTGLAAPTGTTDATNKNYVDATVTNTIGPIPDGDTYVTATGSTTLRKISDRWADVLSVKDFGAVGDGVADDAAAIQAAINYAGTAVNGAAGKEIFFPTGVYLISTTLLLPNRVALRGAGGRGTQIKVHSTFASSYMFHASNGTSSMFGSMLTDLHIVATGKNMIAVIWAQAWQETSGLERVVIQFDGTTRYGVYITDGYGGAAFIHFNQCEIFSESTYATAAAIQVDQISAVGGFVLHVTNATITGSAANTLPFGIRMINDALSVDTYHGEYVTNMISTEGAGSLNASAVTGSFNAVTNIVNLGASYTGRLVLNGIVPNGASGNTLNDLATSRHIAASDGLLPFHDSYTPSSYASVSAQISNVTGNGTEYLIIFDQESYDYNSNYDTSTGRFTAPKTGLYMVNAGVKILPGLSVTTFIAKISGGSTVLTMYRGDTDSIREGSGYVTVSGGGVISLNAAQSVFVSITATGLGADTVDVIETSGETYFQVHWLHR